MEDLMTNETDVFQVTTQSQDNPADSTPEADLLKAIVAPDGRQKYNSVPEALKGLAHSQAHIQKLESELAELQKKVGNAEEIKNVLQEIKQAKQAVEQPSPTVAPPNLDAVVPEIVQKVLTQREQEQARTENRKLVSAELIKLYGDAAKAAEARAAKEAELGISLAELAERSPKAALAFFQIPVQATPTKTTGSVSTAAVGNQVQPPKVQNVMFGASTKDIMSAWRAAKPE
jgi:hypothetical protein